MDLKSILYVHVHKRNQIGETAAWGTIKDWHLSKKSIIKYRSNWLL